ncbi:SufE family protein [Salinibacterium hongtaonis]|uniref:Cysteine desulfuration protein SufE n=1 Tax=Homoserinimonas hongtaonis TaxID=2079791 RepID=A0A2U1SYT5_9MICO|nr:SufE family protein [Salinibacterium hongtaonis]PWB96762.1 cysteine desulfuration protein SufE [Salinibacterium hongtaonis]
MNADTLPPALAEIRDEFLALEQKERLLLLLEFSNELPDLPARYSEHPDLLERVEECQAPVYLFTEVDDDNVVHLFVTAPPEAPTTRGFASILVQGLDGLSVEEVLAVPDDYPNTIGLAAAISPLRLRGMSALLARAKRQVRERRDSSAGAGSVR